MKGPQVQPANQDQRGHQQQTAAKEQQQQREGAQESEPEPGPVRQRESSVQYLGDAYLGVSGQAGVSAATVIVHCVVVAQGTWRPQTRLSSTGHQRRYLRDPKSGPEPLQAIGRS